MGIITIGDHCVRGICHKPRLRPPSPQSGWQDITVGLASPHTLAGLRRIQRAAQVCGPGVCVPSLVLQSLAVWPWEIGLNCAQPQFPHLKNGNFKTSCIGSQ